MASGNNNDTKFSSEQLEVLKQAFNKYDKNGDGMLISTELEQLLKGFGQKVKTQAEIDYIYSSVGRNRSFFFNLLLSFPNFFTNFFVLFFWLFFQQPNKE